MFLEVEDAIGKLFGCMELIKWSLSMSAAQNGIVSHVVMNVILTMACVLVMMSMIIHSVAAREVSLAK